ncbi:DUF6174 domain-containing protein [Cytophagaceae bacterium YF14B1]|uniref:DUF6174 domain-containing protein n=1 Tax=Xanthocytophaga flava TaxID=3048013 RepID=A0AAE3QHW3_9BACT|nr:DUF6174 domain-containing protein [Xanthocytophaga flavus]MDJ1478911.1 DUF6174 domain-containing protein [Xanthocytophaga flavus]
MKPALFIVSLLLLLACSKDESTSAELKANSSRWASKRLVNYTFTQRLNCFCIRGGEKMTVIVQNNQIVDVKDSTGASLPAELQKNYKTIDELFQLIQTTDPKSVALINVTYDDVLGYPKSIYIDKSEQMADEEIGYDSENVSH